MDIQVFHDYRRLSRRGIVKPLTHSCGQEYILRENSDEKVGIYLQCFLCNTKTYPGLKMYEDIRSVVKEFRDD